MIVPNTIVCLRLDHLGDLLMTLPAILPLSSLTPRNPVKVLVSRRWSDLAKRLPKGIELIPIQPSWTTPPPTEPDSFATLLQTVMHSREDLSDGLVISFRDDPRDHILARLLARNSQTLGPMGRWSFLLHHRIDAAVGSCHEVERCQRFLVPLGLDPRAKESTITVLSPPPSPRRRSAPRPLITLHPGAASAPKRWLIDRFVELCGALIQRDDVDVDVFFGPGEESLRRSFAALPNSKHLRLVQPRSIVELADLLESATLLVCNDSGPMHLAEAVGTPVVALFGPTSEEVTGPVLLASRVLTTPCRDRPCWLPGTPAPTCDVNACFNGLTVDSVLETIEGILSCAALNRSSTYRLPSPTVRNP